MKALLTTAILGLTGLAGAAGADAQETRTPRHGHGRPDFRYRPRLEHRWVAPRYETIYAGRDHCGRPVFRTICVSAGYWTVQPTHCR